jgi:hypothetical protein
MKNTLETEVFDTGIFAVMSVASKLVIRIRYLELSDVLKSRYRMTALLHLQSRIENCGSYWFYGA